MYKIEILKIYFWYFRNSCVRLKTIFKMAVALPSTVQEAMALFSPSLMESESLWSEFEVEFGANASDELKLYFWRRCAAEHLPQEQRFAVPVPDELARMRQELSDLKTFFKQTMSTGELYDLWSGMYYLSRKEQIEYLQAAKSSVK